jgi:hypothetical protein
MFLSYCGFRLEGLTPSQLNSSNTKNCHWHPQPLNQHIFGDGSRESISVGLFLDSWSQS